MSECGPCKRNKANRDGGPLGLCWKHQKTRCGICGTQSLGDDLCTKCKFEEEIIRWQEAAMRALNPDDDEWDIKLRREKLLRAKYLAHQAVEMRFRSLIMEAEGIWGGLPTKYADIPGAHPFSEDKQQQFPFEVSA